MNTHLWHGNNAAMKEVKCEHFELEGNGGGERRINEILRHLKKGGEACSERNYFPSGGSREEDWVTSFADGRLGHLEKGTPNRQKELARGFLPYERGWTDMGENAQRNLTR